ncbi:MAG: hypothetical protein R3E79_40580 [Caldilineaceae bacterium]
MLYTKTMVNYTPIIQNLPADLQVTLLQLVEAVEQNLREQLTPPREEIIDVRALANGLVENQQSTLQRMDRLETVLIQLADAQQQLTAAQQRTEVRLEQLADAQQRTEVRLEQLADAQQRTEVRLEQLADAQQRTEARLEQLADAQQRTEARLEQLADAQQQLTTAQQRTEARLEQLADAQQNTEQEVSRLVSAVNELTKSVTRMQPRLAKADGWQLEQRYIERAPSYFGRWLRQIDVLWPGRLDRTLEKQLDDVLTPAEKDEVLRLDAIFRGKATVAGEATEVYVALEASVTVNQYDVERAYERAALLRRLGLHVVAVAAGEMIEAEAEEMAQANAVALFQNGKRQGWEQALAAA